MNTSLARSRLLSSDVARLGVSGLVSRPTRAVLSALGIAIGIAAMVAVVGISTSSQAKLAATLDQLGTNLLSASQGQDFFGETVDLPLTAGVAAGRTQGVESAATTGLVADTGVYRNSKVPENNTNGITLRSTSNTLLKVLEAKVAKGVWLTDGMARYPVVVLGAEAANRLGITEPGRHVIIGGSEYVVAGILQPVPLAPEIDSSALIGEQAGEALAGSSVHPSAVYVRADPERVGQVRDMLARAIQPQSPSDVEVTRPSDALAAQQAADKAFTGLLVGLGGVALLVGGIGVANTMVISVLERRREIGLRRALGATRSHIRQQFLAEALFLSLLGGVAGVLLGVVVTGVFAALQGWPLAVPPVVLVTGLVATLVIGALAGLWPSVRAARIPPTEALQS